MELNYEEILYSFRLLLDVWTVEKLTFWHISNEFWQIALKF